MGVYASRLTDSLSALARPTPVRILIMGLDGAGKSTILDKLRPEVVTTIPVICSNVTTAQYKKILFTVWEVEGIVMYRRLWRHYSPNTQGIIYVVNSADVSRMAEARDELQSIISSDELACIPLLVLANKQDLPNPWSTIKITDFLVLYNVPDRDWYVQATSATQGDGVHEGLEWLTREIKRR
ncbi:ARF/SAR superfamily protein [Serendipita vermifera]|nr:ARF/SAR superfamily protein [Serendipita vermifera]